MNSHGITSKKTNEPLQQEVSRGGVNGVAGSRTTV